MLHYVSYEDITGEPYRQLINYSVEHSDAFLLVYFSYGRFSKMKSTARKMHDSLKQLKIKVRQNPTWPHTSSIDTQNTYKIVFYRSTPEAKPVLLSACTIFSWDYPNPMDLCFFTNGVCWLSTTAHEEYVNFYFRTREEANRIMDFNIPLEFCGEISDEKVYHETY